MGTPGERAETAKTLREDAHQLLIDTGLAALLTDRFAEPEVAGSAHYDLMVWRDIDLHLPVEADRWQEWLDFGRDLSAQLESVGLSLHKATYINDYVDPHPLGTGLHWAIEFKDHAGSPWKVDIWGWDPFDFAVRQARDASFRADLLGCNRDLILRLKTEARQRPHYYGLQVTSWDIYQFAIEKAGDSLAALERWKAKQ